MAKTGRDAKKPQIPAFREENRPRRKKRQIPGNGGQNAPPDEKSPENRKAEKAMAKTGREAKKPQIPASGAENRPRHKKRQIPGNGGQNASPDGRSETPESPKGGDPNSNPALALVNTYPRKFAHGGAIITTWRNYKGRKLGPYYRLRFRAQGRIREVYLGREGPRVQAVRDRLAELHAALARRRMYDKMVKTARARPHVDLAALQQQLEAAGLRSQACQVRGLRANLAGR